MKNKYIGALSLSMCFSLCMHAADETMQEAFKRASYIFARTSEVNQMNGIPTTSVRHDGNATATCHTIYQNEDPIQCHLSLMFAPLYMFLKQPSTYLFFNVPNPTGAFFSLGLPLWIDHTPYIIVTPCYRYRENNDTYRKELYVIVFNVDTGQVMYTSDAHDRIISRSSYPVYMDALHALRYDRENSQLLIKYNEDTIEAVELPVPESYLQAAFSIVQGLLSRDGLGNLL